MTDQDEQQHQPSEAEILEIAQEEAAAEFEAITLEGLTPDTEEKSRLYRFVRLHTRYTAEIARIEAQAAAMIRSLESKQKALEYVHQPACSDITRRLLKAAGGKSKSHKTPFGTVGFRTSKAGIEIVDADAFIAAAKAAGLAAALVRTTEAPNKAALNDHFKATGEEMAGTKLKEESEKFYVS